MSRGDIVVRLIGDFHDLEHKLDQATRKTKSTFDKISGYSKVAFFAIAGAAATLGEQSIHAADDFEKSHARLQNAIKNTGGNIQRITPYIADANKRMEAFGFTNAQTEEALSHLATATNDPEKALSQMGLAANIARARNLDLVTASDLLAKVMAGNLRPLKQFGIDLPIAAGGALKLEQAQKAVAKAQEAVTEAQKKGGTHTAAYGKALANLHDKQQDLAKASHATSDILSVLNQRFGGSAQAQADTFAGKMEVLHTKLTDLEVKIGLKLIPVIEKLADKISNIITWFERHKTAAKSLEIAIGSLVTAFSLLWLVNTGRKVAEAVSSLLNFFGITESGMAAVGTSATQAGIEVEAAASGMSIAFGALSAAIAGYAIGTVINKTIVAPAIKGFEDMHDKHRQTLSQMVTDMDEPLHNIGLKSAQFIPLENALQRLGDKGIITSKNFGNVSAHIDILAAAIKNHIRITDQMLADLAAGGSRAAGVVRSIQTAIDNLHGKTVDINFNETIQRHTIDYVTPSAQGDVTGVTQHKGYVPSFHSGMLPDEYLAKLQKGEAVINRRSTAAYAPLLAAINSGRAMTSSTVSHVGVVPGTSVTYQILINVPPTANKAEIGRELVEAVQAYERRSGASWRQS